MMRIIKALVMSAGLLLSLVSWGQDTKPADGYVINGTITGKYTGKVYLVREEGIHGEQIVVDSCEVVKGKYFFKGPRVEQVIMYFVKSNDEQLTPLFLENGNISITGRADNFLWAEVRGTLNNEIRHFYNFLANYPLDSSILSAQIDWTRFGRTDREKERKAFRNRTNRINLSRLNTQRQLVSRFNDQVFAPFIILFEMVSDVSADEVKELRAKLSPDLSNHPYVKDLDDFIANQEFNVGSIAYDFTLPGMNGKEIGLKDYRGKYVLLDFWASWCGPCRQEMPNVVKLYKSCRGKKFEIIGISLDNKDKLWRDAVKEMKMTWPQACDFLVWQGKTAKKYNVQAIPKTVLIDPNGKVVAIDLRGEALLNKVKELIK